jgi:predicted transcriptional regulator of viral defense system
MSDSRRLRSAAGGGWRRGMSHIAALRLAGGGELGRLSHFKSAMRTQNESPRRAVAELAHRQYGVVAHAELIDLGLSLSGVNRWLAEGSLHPVYRGVYAVGHPLLTEFGRWLAAVKACGRGAVLSHISAAALWDLIRSSSPIIHVTTPNRRSPRGIRVHRVRRVHEDDVAVIDGIPVTSVARTLLDLADVFPARRLIRAIEQAERLQIFDLRAVERLMARSGGRRTNALGTAIAAVTGEPPRVNSDWERDLLDFCDDHCIPRPELNVLVEGYEVDALWRAQRVVVELDSWAFHRSRRAFEADREKYADLQLARYLVLPITRLDDAAARRISAAIGTRPAPTAARRRRSRRGSG